MSEHGNGGQTVETGGGQPGETGERDELGRLRPGHGVGAETRFQVGNPGGPGRPTRVEAVRRLCTEDVEIAQLAAELAAAAKRGGPGCMKLFRKMTLENPRYIRSILARLVEGGLAPAVEVAVLAYAYGKPLDRIEHSFRRTTVFRPQGAPSSAEEGLAALLPPPLEEDQDRDEAT